MFVPFPSIESELARKSHMYVCLASGTHKQFVKCQTFKPIHLARQCPPYHYIVEKPDATRNPFLRQTTIDCDKIFLVSHVTIHQRLLASRNVCDALYQVIQHTINKHCCPQETLDSQELLQINPQITLRYDTTS
jgi:hypothetical protein